MPELGLQVPALQEKHWREVSMALLDWHEAGLVPDVRPFAEALAARIAECSGEAFPAAAVSA